MCGICGFYTKHKENLENLIKMNETMIHRGPDDHGEEIFDCMKDTYHIGMAHRRLSVQDLSVLGHQPMHSNNGRVVVTFNGEIYNFQELKSELSEYPFQSNCDTEVILAAYLKWGITFVKRLNGMFAIALFDKEDDSLYLIRDRIGKKPLYYYIDSGNLYYASELKPLMADPYFEKQIDDRIVGKFLYRQYINAPDTIFQSTYKLRPGEIVRFRNGQIKKRKYWDVASVYNHKWENISYGEAKERLELLLKEAVSKRLVADVPVGEFLSGGYDSALVCALAQSVSAKPINTYSIGFYDKELDEAPFARSIAQHLGTNHTEYYISEREMFDLVKSIPYYYDEPFADSSQICTMLVSELARKDVTVVLTGDGGDEMFGGYTIYERIADAQQKKMFGIMLHYLMKIPFVRAKYDYTKIPFVYRVASESFLSATKTQTGSGQYFEILDRLLICKEHDSYLDPIEDRYREKDWVYRRMLLDMDTYLPGDILCKVDRAGMKYSLEARCPFLDKDVMEFSLGLPLEYKMKNGELKRILKEITYNYIPKKLMDRPKQGFGVPIERWLRNELREELLAYTDSVFLKKQGIFNIEETQKFIHYFIQNGNMGKNTGKNYGGFVWAYFIFQQWYQVYERN